MKHPAHEVFIDPNIDQPNQGEMVGTFSGQVPAEGQRIQKRCWLRPIETVAPGLRDLPRYFEETYIVNRVEWTLTDEAEPLRAKVFVALPKHKRP